MTSKGRTERLGDLLWIAFALAVIPNTLAAFDVAPDGDWWRVVRIVLSTVFTLTLLAFAASWLSDRRKR